MESSVADSPAERALQTRAGERARAKLMKFSDAMSRDLLPETGQAGERAGGPADGSIASTLDPRRRRTRSPAGARVGGRR